MKVTVFTPVYNRAAEVAKLYYSLLRQTSKEFEWVVVDDGSTDDIDIVIQRFVENPARQFDIIYKKQANGGKHTAINKGVEIANGEVFFIVDSDDYIVDDAIDTIVKAFQDCPRDYAGIGLQRITPNGELIGNTFKGSTCDCLASERTNNSILGDKAEVYYTAIMRKYPFEVFENEKFLSEASVWYRIAHDGKKIRWINKPGIVCEYLPGGLTDNAEKLAFDNIRGVIYTAKVMLSCRLHWIEKLKIIGNCAYICKKKKMKISGLSRVIKVCRIDIYIAYTLCFAKKHLQKLMYKSKL